MKVGPRRTLWAGTLLTGATGVALLVIDLVLTSEDPFSVYNHPTEPWFLKSHILVAPILTLGLGMVLFDHALRHFRSGTKPGRRTGLILSATTLPMIFSGYLIQTTVEPLLLGFYTWLHIGSSIGFLVVALLHLPRFRKQRTNGR